MAASENCFDISHGTIDLKLLNSKKLAPNEFLFSLI